MKYILFLFYIIYLTSCGGIYSDDDRDRRRDRDRRYGQYDDDDRVRDPCSNLYTLSENSSDNDDEEPLPTELGESSFFNLKCDANQPGPPLTMTDIITSSIIGWNTIDKQARNCVSQKLQQANDCLCVTRDRLETQRSQYRDDGNIMAATRVEHSLNQLNGIEHRYRTNLNQIRRQAQGRSNQDVINSGNFWAQLLNFAVKDNMRGWEIIFDTEAHIQCYSSYDDDEYDRRGYDRRRDDRGRGSDRNRRRSRNVRDSYY